MKKQDQSIIIGVGAALVGFGIYLYSEKKRQSEKAEKAESDSTNATNNPNITTGYPNYQGANSYQQKVMDIQSILGVAIDGSPGAQTNGALSKKVPLTFAKYGPITPANALFYVTLLKGPSFLWV